MLLKTKSSKGLILKILKLWEMLLKWQNFIPKLVQMNYVCWISMPLIKTEKLLSKPELIEKYAKNGKEKYFRLYNSKKVAKNIIELTF